MAARKNLLTALALPAVVVVAVLAGSALFIVDEREKALVLRLGRVVDVQETPGLNFKLPFIDNVVKYDGRILGPLTSPLEVTLLDDRRLRSTHSPAGASPIRCGSARRSACRASRPPKCAWSRS